MVLERVELVRVKIEASIFVSAPPPSTSPFPPSSLTTGTGRRPPSLPRTPLVTAAPRLLVVVIATVAVGGAVQGVAAVAALLVLVGALLVEATLVTLLPGTVRAGGAHSRGRSWEGKGQQSRTLRGRGGGRRRAFISLLFTLPPASLSLPQTQILQGGAGWSP